MAAETDMPESVKPFRKRKVGHKKGYKAKKKQKQFQGMKERVKMDPKIKKLLQKKARDYNSDDGEEQIKYDAEEEKEDFFKDDDDKDFGIELEGLEQEEEEEEEEEEEDGEIQPGITKLAEGCRAFRIAFQSIMAKTVPDDSLGPVLSGHQKLVVEKLAEDETGKKVKREAKKEKHLMEEKGHVKPANYLDTHEKFLISVATKGVVKLFNAVNRAQNAQKGLDPSRTKDAKVIKNRRKQAFFSELGKTQAAADAKVKSGSVNIEGPAWAPLRDNYMLTNSKLKDWDRKQDTVAADDIGKISEDSGSDDD